MGKVRMGLRSCEKLILELAVRGKLVPQDPNDEPASVLLEKIAKEQARLVKEGKIKKDKPLPKINEDEEPFDLPVGWEWVRFGSIAQHNAGKTLDSRRNSGEPRDYLTTSNLYWGRFDLTEVRQMQIKEDELEKCTAQKGDLLICEGGEAGRAAVWEEDRKICFQNHVHRVRFYGDINPYYAYRFFEQINATGEIEKYRKGVGISNMSGKSLASITFPLPPKDMQQKIVAKVDELMALCDKLEQQQTDNNETHQTMVETLLATLTTVADPAEFAVSWQRIAAHFDTLFTTEESIDQLKQTILHLAVMGKLSSPNSDDSPIEKLLEQIAIEKKSLEMTGKEEKILETEIGLAKKDLHGNNVKLKARTFCDFITKGTTPSKNELIPQGDVPFLKVYNIVNNELDFVYRPIFISKEVHETKLKRSKVFPGDVIMNIVGPPLGKVAIVTDEYSEWNMNQALAVFRPLAGIYNRYIYYVLSTNSVLKSVLEEVRGMAGQDNLSLEQCRDLSISIPSLEEQHRIVAKVDELMTLCDTLKERLHKAQITQVQLADAIIEQALVA